MPDPPILAGTVLFHEGLPEGILGVLRALAFAGVAVGAALPASPADRTEGADRAISKPGLQLRPTHAARIRSDSSAATAMRATSEFDEKKH